MRILHVLKDLKNSGNGVTNAAVDLACAQRRLGHDVAVAASFGEYQSFLDSTKVLHFEFKQATSVKGFFGSCICLYRIIRHFNPEIVHCHLAPGMIVARIVRCFTQFSIVAHIHNVQERRSGFMRLADAVIAVSRAVADQIARKGMPKRKLFVVQSRYINSPRRQSCAMPEMRPLQQPAIVTVAGLNKRKNIDGLLDAFQKISEHFKSAHLYIVGDGPDRVELQAKGRACKAASRIHFEGFQRDPQPYMRQAHIFVLASHRESFGLVLHEAREAGAAIIASNVDGIPEALDHGAAGMLVPPGDVNALAHALAMLLSDTNMHQKWKLASQANLSQHSVGEMADEVICVYREVLGLGTESVLTTHSADTTVA